MDALHIFEGLFLFPFVRSLSSWLPSGLQKQQRGVRERPALWGLLLLVEELQAAPAAPAGSITRIGTGNLLALCLKNQIDLSVKSPFFFFAVKCCLKEIFLPLSFHKSSLRSLPAVPGAALLPRNPPGLLIKPP